MHRQITACRLCGSEGLDVLLELGTQFLTGVFPRGRDDRLTKGPLTLVRCGGCGLVQLLHTYERTELYGAHYGYRSSLNRMMVDHLGRPRPQNDSCSAGPIGMSRITMTWRASSAS